MSKNERTKIRLISVEERIKTFNEVACGYNEEEAYLEASRCLNCTTKPCTTMCPVGVDIPAFIKEIKNGDINQAYLTIVKTNILPAICGRVCPQEKQCESACVYAKAKKPIAIGRLERYVADNATVKNDVIATKNGKSVAVVGSGPAGLTCAGTLAKAGYSVTVYEAMHMFGGVTRYGIPEFRLPKKIVDLEIDNLRNLGVKLVKNVVIGKTITVEELLADNDAVFIGTGAGLPKFMNIPGENLNGVLSANEFLTRVNLMKANLDNFDTPIKHVKNVAVVGGGNVAMDASRVAVRLNAENVYLIYRRSRNEMPAREEEIEHAIEEGVKLLELTNPIEIVGSENVEAVICRKMKLQKDPNGGRDIPVETDETIKVKVDTLIMAIGNFPNPLLSASTKDLKTDRRGCIVVSEDGLTSIPKVYAGGDAVSGAATVILAMEAGKKAANEIDKQLNEQSK